MLPAACAALLLDYGELAARVGIAGAFALVGLCCVVLTAIGLPGLWGVVLLAGGLRLFDHWQRGDADLTFSAWTVIAAVAVAIAAEVFEFAAGAAGARKAGASKRGMVGATIGGIVGAIAGAPFGLIVGALVGGTLGAALGAIALEMTAAGRTLESSLKPAAGAATGRLFGTAGKLLATIALWIALTVAAFV